jgi:16S rRNA (guanine527-N7)-methyltransferase
MNFVPSPPPPPDLEPVHQQLMAEAARWNLPASAAQLDALLRFGTELLTWSRRINLTAATSLTQLATEHLPDSFVLASRIPGPARIVDVGSGGGLPALPLAILRETCRFELVEATGKKVAFLRHAVRLLGLSDRVVVRHGRIDPRSAPPDFALGRTFDVAVSRATFSPDAWLVLACQLTRPGGRVFALSSSGTLAAPGGLTPEATIRYGQRRFLHELHVPRETSKDGQRST